MVPQPTGSFPGEAAPQSPDARREADADPEQGQRRRKGEQADAQEAGEHSGHALPWRRTISVIQVGAYGEVQPGEVG